MADLSTLSEAIIKGEQNNSRDYYNKAVLCHQSDYWRKRFASFGLDEVLNNFPQTESEVFATMEYLHKSTFVY